MLFTKKTKVAYLALILVVDNPRDSFTLKSFMGNFAKRQICPSNRNGASKLSLAFI